jgi:hypothetical protein
MAGAKKRRPRAHGEGAGAERFKVARGSVSSLGKVVLAFLAIMVGWCLALVGIIRALAALDVRVGAPFAVGSLLVLVVSLLVYLNLPGRVTVGADGIFIDWRGKRVRFVAFTDLEGACVYRERTMGKVMVGVAAALGSGEVVKVLIGEDQFGASARAAALAARIELSLEAHRRVTEDVDTSMLRRGDRTAEAWLARLRGLGEGANAGPREAPIPPDRLFRIVESANAEPEARAAAALALVPTLDEGGKTRLRIAAESTAAPMLRVALECAASGDDEGALDALEKASPRRRL